MTSNHGKRTVADRIMQDAKTERRVDIDMRPPADVVNHPPHYTFGTIEVITAIEDWQLDFHEANTVKYVARAKHKGNRLEDLRKARWYLDRKIAMLETQP